MALATGSVLGVYEILGSLGAGGMGEVFRARDTKLGRDVAIKILPESFTHDPERVARFRREAQILASLNHQNIGAIYGLDEAGSAQFLVLELVDGESLASRIARGPLSLADAMSIATDVAHALEAAHEQGIVHRDLKPANIVLTKDGRAKVLDFGLAKSIDSGSSVSQSPAITFMATMAQTQGVILGTAAYMSPEQAKGQAADKRTDVWAFGCVLYEMLSGRKPFSGDDISDTIASVLRDAPDMSALPAAVPAGVRDVIVRCLEKNRRDRIPDVSAARLLLAAAGSGPATSAFPVRAPRTLAGGWLPWTVSTVLACGLIAMAARQMYVPASPDRTMRIRMRLGVAAEIPTNQGEAAVLSPDGRMLAFAATARAGDPVRLYVRHLDELDAQLLPGTERAFDPFFSPDSRWVGFFANRKLWKIAVTGGAAVPLADAHDWRGAAWTPDGILAQLSSLPGVALMRVPASGGAPSPALTMPEGVVTQRWPQVLPGGRQVLYSTGALAGAGFNNGNLIVQDLSGSPSKVVLKGGYHGRYVRSGHLVYVHDASLVAVPFDLARLEVTGPPVTIAQGVVVEDPTGGAQFSVSDAGMLSYVSGSDRGDETPLMWLNSSSALLPLRAIAAQLSDPRFSPDGQRLAMDITATTRDIWVYDWARDTQSRLTNGPSDNSSPIWSPDGRSIAFSARLDKRFYNLAVIPADGTRPADRLLTATQHQITGSWHPSGNYIAYGQQSPDTNFDLMILPLRGSSAAGWTAGTPTVFLRTPANEQNPEFSPDGHWLAYQSDESGRNEAYVRPFPGGDRKWQISSAGATYPMWSKTAPSVFYAALDGQIMEVPYTVAGDVFQPEKPKLWSTVRFSPGLYRRYDIHPDGRRFAIAKSADDGRRGDEVTVVFDLFNELRRLSAAAR